MDIFWPCGKKKIIALIICSAFVLGSGHGLFKKVESQLLPSFWPVVTTGQGFNLKNKISHNGLTPQCLPVKPVKQMLAHIATQGENFPLLAVV